MTTTNHQKVAILATDGFEQTELKQPVEALEQAHIDVQLVSLETGRIQGYHHAEKGDQFEVDATLHDVSASDFDALVLPGGLHNPDSLRTSDPALDFVRSFYHGGKPVAAICHAPWILINAGIAKGRRMTSYHSIAADVKNAGASWFDEEVVIDGNLITSRNPADLPAFCEALLAALGVTMEV